MNYLRLGGLFKTKYAYVDLNVDCDYVADSLFYKRKIPVNFKKEWIKDGEKYRIIVCSIHKKYEKPFEEALEEIKSKMILLGHNDYEEFCDNLMKELEIDKHDRKVD